MLKDFFICILFCVLMSLNGLSQSSAQPTIPGTTYYPPQHYKASWQRLYLLLSATFLVAAKEGQVDLDSCMIAASRSIGLSRYCILGEGIDDPGFFEQSKWVDRQAPAVGIQLLSKSKGVQHLKLLLLLGGYYAFQPGSYYKDTALYFLNRAFNESKLLKEDKLKRQVLCLLVKVYAQRNDEKANSLCQSLITTCRQAGDKETIAKVLAYRSKYTPPMATTMKRKIEDAQQAAVIFDSIGNIEGEISALTDLGYLQLIFAQSDSAYKNHLKAFELADAIHFPYIHYNTQALITTTLFQGKFGDPLRYAYQTIRSAEETRDSIAWGYFYTNLADILGWDNRSKESLEWAQKSVKHFVTERNTSVYRILYLVILNMNNKGRAKEALNLALDISGKCGIPITFSDEFSYHLVFSECYINLQLLDEAEMHIRKMDSLETKAEGIRGPMRRSEVDFQFAHLFTKRKQYRKARGFLQKRFDSPARMDGYLATNLEAYRQLVYIDSVLEDHPAAEAHYKKYAQLLDSSYRVSTIRQAEELQVVYQMKEKESQINLLTQQATLEKSNSAEARLLRNLTIAGIFVVLVIAGLLFRQNRLRKKTNLVITAKNDQLQQLVADKEWLLKEVHHRVKNNLQIIISLLDSQSEYINNDAALAAIEDNLRRVHAMALIHQKLYQTDDYSTISMPEYINEVVNYARDSFDTGNRIRFKQTIKPLNLDISQVIPIGLIINECIVNAIKYAFPDNRNGAISINFYQDGTNHLVLEISDNGIGLQEAFNTNAHSSLGLDLMQGLSKQLNGTFNYESNNGLHITIKFPVSGYNFPHKLLINS